MKAMILAAGRGKRMGKLTETTPKPLLEVDAKPLIVWQLERLAKAGINQVVINLGYLGEKIRERLGTGREYNMEITYSREPEEGLETAGGIIQALPLLSDNPFLVVNADVWCDVDFNSFAADFNSKDFGKLLLVKTPGWKEKGDFGYREGRVLAEGDYTFSGISVWHPRTFLGLQPGFRPLAPIMRKFAECRKLAGMIHLGDWQDIGTPERLMELQTSHH